MRRTLAAFGTVLLLSPLAGCGDDDSGDQTAAATETSESAAADQPALKVLPEPAPSLPTSPPTSLPTEVSKALGPGGASLDACEVVSPDLVTEVFGAGPGQSVPEESGLGDPEAIDCYYYSGESLVAVQATTRADQDFPESSYTYDGIPGAVEVPGADRGWAVIFPGQEGSDSLVSGLIVVKGQLGLNMAISIQGQPYDMDTVLEFADQLLERM